MAQSPEDPNQQYEPTGLAVDQQPEPILTLRQRFSAAIGRLDDGVYQPMLRRLEQFQKKEKEREVGSIRGGIRKIVNSDAYKAVDKWLLTYFAIFGVPALEFLAARTGTYIDDTTKQAFLDCMNLGLAAGFTLDTLGNTAAHGSRYYFSVDDKLETDGVERGRKEVNWEPAPLINLTAVAGSMSALELGSVRLARLLRFGRLSKMARLSKIRGVDNSLEDEGAEMIGKDFTRFIFVFTAAMAGISSAAELDFTNPAVLAAYLAGAGIISKSIQRQNSRNRGVLAKVFTRRFETLDRRILEAFGSDPQLKHFAKIYKQGGNELDLIEDRFFRLFRVSQELLNPTGEETEVDENGDIITKFVDRTVMFTDVRGYTAMSNHHSPEEIEPVMAAYISDMYPIVNAHGGRFANLMGDGTALFFKDHVDEETGRVTPASELAVRCALALQSHSAKYDRIFQEELPIEGKNVSHITGIGINSGKISVGDPFRKRKGHKGIRRPEILGDAVNTAARVESLNKTFPGHVTLVTEDEYRTYSGSLRAMFRYCGTSHMKGIGDLRIWGLPGDGSADVGYDADSFILDPSQKDGA